MITKKIITYNPYHTIKENAINNNVTESSIRKYIKVHNIDRNFETANVKIERIKDVLSRNPKASIQVLMQECNLSRNTVKKYLSYAQGEKYLSKYNTKKVSIFDTIRADHDFYTTDARAVKALLNVEKFNDIILDPCCGTGSIVQVLKERNYTVRATDLIYRGCGEGNIDFLNDDFPAYVFDIIMNPPYTRTIDFIQKALSLAKQKVAVLLPLSYIESQERYEKIYSKSPPSTIYAFINRIQIKKGDVSNGNTKANMKAYAWYVWDKGHKESTILHWIHA